MYIYICMYIFTYIYIHIRAFTYACIHIHISRLDELASIAVASQEHAYTHIYVSINICIRMHMYMSAGSTSSHLPLSPASQEHASVSDVVWCSFPRRPSRDGLYHALLLDRLCRVRLVPLRYYIYIYTYI